MPTTQGTTTPPSCLRDGDKRIRLLEVVLKKHQFRQDALIEVLHAAQQSFGYLGLDLLGLIARRLKLPPSRVYGVATFYHLFRLKPKGRHTCVVCTGTACYVKGSDALLAALKQTWVGAGETTSDGSLSVLTARCLGACGVAPVVVLDGAVKGNMEPATLVAGVKGLVSGGTG